MFTVMLGDLNIHPNIPAAPGASGVGPVNSRGGLWFWVLERGLWFWVLERDDGAVVEELQLPELLLFPALEHVVKRLGTRCQL